MVPRGARGGRGEASDGADRHSRGEFARPSSSAPSPGCAKAHSGRGRDLPSPSDFRITQIENKLPLLLLQLAALRLEEYYDPSRGNIPPDLRGLPKPLIGFYEPEDERAVRSSTIFGEVEHYPAFRYILSNSTLTLDGEVHKREVPEGEESGSVLGGNDWVEQWDHMTDRSSPAGIFRSVRMYWYRHVATGVNLSTGRPVVRESQAPVFEFNKMTDVSDFFAAHGEDFLRPARARRRRYRVERNPLEREMFEYYMGRLGRLDGPRRSNPLWDAITADEKRETLNEIGDIFFQHEPVGNHQRKITESVEVDPYLLLIQCRNVAGFEGWTAEDLARRIEAMNAFDALAREMVHRSDAVFVTVESYDEEEEEKGSSSSVGSIADCGHNGSVRLVRARRFVHFTRRVRGAAQKEEEDRIEEDEVDSIHPDNSTLDAAGQRKPSREDGGRRRKKASLWNRNFVRRDVRHVQTNWNEAFFVQRGAVIFEASGLELPKEAKRMHEGGPKDPSIPQAYIASDIAAATVVHTTPTVLWFDRDLAAQLAFPWYRKVHCVLFVDAMLDRADVAHLNDRGRRSADDGDFDEDTDPWPPSLVRSADVLASLVRHQRAVEMFHEAALRQRRMGGEDVVFLIVPSSEVRVLSSFGVDLWSGMDEELFDRLESGEEGREGSCSSAYGGGSRRDDRDVLPAVMLTDDTGRVSAQTLRYYLNLNTILSDESMVSRKSGDFITQFLSHYRSGSLVPFYRSEPAPPTEDGPGRNVTVLTGDTFRSVVMDAPGEHTMVMVHSPTCGHCKRFSTFWNEFGSLVEGLNWSSVVRVAKIDASRNDVPHDAVDPRELPAAYYFPPGEKGAPIEVTRDPVEFDYKRDGDKVGWVRSGFDLVKWMIEQDRLDLEALRELDGGPRD